MLDSWSAKKLADKYRLSLKQMEVVKQRCDEMFERVLTDLSQHALNHKPTNKPKLDTATMHIYDVVSDLFGEASKADVTKDLRPYASQWKRVSGSATSSDGNRNSGGTRAEGASLSSGSRADSKSFASNARRQEQPQISNDTHSRRSSKAATALPSILAIPTPTAILEQVPPAISAPPSPSVSDDDPTPSYEATSSPVWPWLSRLSLEIDEKVAYLQKEGQTKRQRLDKLDQRLLQTQTANALHQNESLCLKKPTQT